jgi:hypothetical protein
MNKLPLALAAAIGAAIGGQQLLKGRRFRAGTRAIRRRMMDRMMNSMPEDSPPKLIVSILPRLIEQNDQILSLLKEQNELLRQRSARRGSKAVR